MKSLKVFLISAILISALIHLLLFSGVLLLAPILDSKNNEPIEVTLAPSSPMNSATKKAPEKQLVRQTLLPNKILAPDDNTLAKYLSERRQRVTQESQAAKNGMTANRSNEVPAPQKESQKQSADTDKDGYKDMRKELAQMQQLNPGVSTTGETLSNSVKIGSFTALNTDRYLFYTFYARIEELVRYRWESKVMRAIDSLGVKNAQAAANRNWITQVEFLLDKNGYLKKSQLLKQSGISPFDIAALEAFKEARIFPNPPPEMIEDDGYIHLKFNFNVNYNSQTN